MHGYTFTKDGQPASGQLFPNAEEAENALSVLRTEWPGQFDEHRIATARIVVEPDTAPKPTKPATDHEQDLSDWWAELTDPENEFGEVATGLFDVVREPDGYPIATGHGAVRWIGCTTSAAILTGLWVEGSAGARFVSREMLMKLAGTDEIARIEGLVE